MTEARPCSHIMFWAMATRSSGVGQARERASSTSPKPLQSLSDHDWTIVLAPLLWEYPGRVMPEVQRVRGRLAGIPDLRDSLRSLRVKAVRLAEISLPYSAIWWETHRRSVYPLSQPLEKGQPRRGPVARALRKLPPVLNKSVACLQLALFKPE